MKAYKKCSCCKAIKRVAEFNKSRAESDGLKSYCRDCSVKQCKKYRTKRTTQHSWSSPDNKTGRPGCIVRDGVAFIPDCDRQEWVEMPVKICGRCGIDQHLDICLDCTNPVGQARSGQGINPLFRCEGCNEWRSYISGCRC